MRTGRSAAKAPADNQPEADGNVAISAPAAVDSASWAVVVCTRSGLTVSAKEHGRSFAPGDVVDLTKELALGYTWRDAIGSHLTEFFVSSDGEGA